MFYVAKTTLIHQNLSTCFVKTRYTCLIQFQICIIYPYHISVPQAQRVS